MSMRAFALDEFGAPGSIHQLPIPEPGPGEILVAVHAAGVNVMDPFYVEVVAAVAGALRQGGTVVSPAMRADAAKAALDPLGVVFKSANRLPPSRLPELTALIDGGQLRVPPITAYSLEATSDALKAMAAGHVRGKLVITIR